MAPAAIMAHGPCSLALLRLPRRIARRA
ncbi:hypothetical protein A2U01_0084449, partial [Trifolium medium]|nr:hypothetical protein [Trifolium medium]